MKPDKYGHCCSCHKNLLVPRIINGKEMMSFTPDFDQTEFVISNNSRMVVCMCVKCKAEKDLSSPNVHNNVMKSVKLGWDGELGDSRRQPIDYKDLNILFHSEGMDDYVVKDRLNKLGK